MQLAVRVVQRSDVNVPDATNLFVTIVNSIGIQIRLVTMRERNDHLTYEVPLLAIVMTPVQV